MHLLFKLFNYKSLVDIEKCISFTGFSFGSTGWHHLIKTLEQYDENNNLDLFESSFYKFHSNFKPKFASHIFSSNYKTIKFDFPIGIHPWGSFSKGLGYDLTLPKDWGKSRFFGPTTETDIIKYFNEFIALYKSMKVNKYRPSQYGYIGGTFLINKKNDYRFVVLQGNHRTAICKHLGYKYVYVKPVRGRHKVLHVKDVDNWYFVKENKISNDEAIQYFNLFFTYNGLEQASANKLI